MGFELQKKLPCGRLLAPREAAAYLGITTTALASWAKNDKINYVVTPSGRKLYLDYDIDSFLTYHLKNGGKDE